MFFDKARGLTCAHCAALYFNRFWIPSILASIITKEMFIVKMRIRCRQIGVINAIEVCNTLSTIDIEGDLICNFNYNS